jgi:hypothetical protein
MLGTWQRGIKVAHVIKITNSLSLTQGEHLVYPWFHRNQKGPKSGRVSRRELERRAMIMEAGTERHYSAGCEDGGRGTGAKECRQPLEAGESKEIESSGLQKR